jgi:hypothetical protein
MYIYIYIYMFILFPLLYCNYSFICLYKGYASYVHISRGYVKHKRLKTTVLDPKKLGSTFFRSVDELLPHYMSSYTKRHYYS